MADGQEKSDDLIAELAKLMASTPAQEPAPRTGARLVSLDGAPKPAAPAVRIPGMERVVPPPAAPTPQDQPAAPAPAATTAPRPSPIRIPGMDRPAPAAALPAAGADNPPAPRPVVGRPVSSIDFGAMPPAATVRPEPMSNWQGREIPRPVSFRPIPVEVPPKAEAAPEVKPVADQVAEPVRTEAPKVEPIKAPALQAEAPAIELPPPSIVESDETSASIEPVDVPADKSAPAVPLVLTPAASAQAPAPKAAVPQDISRDAEPTSDRGEEPDPESKAKADANAAAIDKVDFDFGFGSTPPSADASAKPAAPAPTPTPVPVPADPIAALIAAELDGAQGAKGSATADETPKPPANRPAVRTFSAPERSATLTPIRPAAATRAMPVGVAVARRPGGESDRFAVAPVFADDSKPQLAAEGAASAKAATPVPPAVDPIDEIESLIGEAVRVGLSTPASRPEPTRSAPIVPPLNTSFVPRKAAIKEVGPETDAAEAAILAAAAASGADLSRNGAAAVDQNPYRRRTSARSGRRQSRLAQYVGIAVAAVLLLAAGFGIYWVFGMGQGTTEAPVLTADATPDKAAPPASASAPAAAEADGSVVFNKMDGVQDTTAEAIVSRDDSADTSVADVATTVGDGADDSALSEGGLANRKVRTVTVRPDGTIVSGDDAVAGSEALPVDRPNVPDLPGADVQRSDLLAAVPSNTANDPVAAAIVESGSDTAAASADSAASSSVAALVAPDANATIDSSIVAPVPMARPTDRASLADGGTVDQASLQTPASDNPVNLLPAASPPAASAPAQTTTASVSSSTNAAAYAQMSSQKSQADAQASLNSIKSRYGALFQGHALEIQRADLGSKGVWYRVRLPATSFQQATEICASVKANGGDCIPTNG